MGLKIGTNVYEWFWWPCALKILNPHYFKGIYFNRLTVDCKFNRNSWIERNNMTSWISCLNEKIIRQNKKVFLFMNYYATHPQIEPSNIQIDFLSPHPDYFIGSFPCIRDHSKFQNWVQKSCSKISHCNHEQSNMWEWPSQENQLAACYSEEFLFSNWD